MAQESGAAERARARTVGPLRGLWPFVRPYRLLLWGALAALTATAGLSLSLPLAAALEKVPESLLQAAADLGARPGQTFRTVTLPLALPGLAAGSVFTFSLTLGDYIIPSVVGAPGYFIGMMVYVQQGTAGNIPLAAAFSVVPILLIFVYLSIAKRFGAFDAL